MALLGNIADKIKDLMEIEMGDPNGAPYVKLGNISIVENHNSQNGVMLSLVSIEEEKSLRYAHTTTMIPSGNPNNSTVLTHHPIIYLNAYFLVGALDKEYKTALNDLSKVVNFFQSKHIYSSSELGLGEEGFDRLIFELYTTSFEQMNHLWGILGGKYIPSALYKVRFFPHSDIKQENGTRRILRESANSTLS